MKPILKETEILLKNIHDTIQLSSPHWLLKQLVVIFDFTKLTEKNIHHLIVQKKLPNIAEKYLNYTKMALKTATELNIEQNKT